MRADVHVAELEGAGEGEDERDVLLRRGRLADHLDVGGRPRGEPAGEGRVAVDVELEEVEEGVGDEVDGAVDLALGAVVEFEGLGRLATLGKGDPLDLVVVVFKVLSGLTSPEDCQSVCLGPE